MGTTSRFGLHYPDLTDAPNGPAQLQQLAEDADGWLCRAFPCTSSTRPPGVPVNFLIRESDTGNILIWTGSAWSQITGTVTGGGGGGGTVSLDTTWAGWQASTAQPIATGTDVTIAFPTAMGGSDTGVTRSASGAGHSFTLGQTRLWTVSATLRFAQNATGGRTFELRAGGSTILAKTSGPQDTDAPYTANLSVTRRLAAGTVITAVARHNAGTSLALEPNSGQYVHIDLAGI